MADNVTIPATGSGTATPVVATDDVSGAHFQRIKVDLGADGASSPLVRGQQAGASSLPVVVASDQTVPVSAASLPLPSGAATLAEQQTQTASLSVMDDWDESDRAKVNLIAGQAGVAGGSGSVSALTQRVVLATDQPTMSNAQPVTAAQSTASNLNAQVVGAVAHDGAVSGNPVRTAGRGLSADYTAVASGDVADFITTLTGKQVTYPYALPGSTWNYAAASGGITNTTGVTAKAAAGAGVRNYVTSAQVINGHASTATDVQIRDGASGTVLWRGFAQAAGGGVSAYFDPPLRGTANTLVEVACGTTATATYFNLQGFTASE